MKDWTELQVLAEVTEVLERLKIPYMLTGSMAMAYYAVPRMTRDADLVVALRLQDISALAEALEPAFLVSEHAAREALQYQTQFNVIHSESVMKIDFIIRKNEPYRRTEFERRRRVIMDGCTLFIVSKEDLILSKLLWSLDSESEMQRRDIKNLVATGIDSTYLNYWLAEFELTRLFEEIIHA